MDIITLLDDYTMSLFELKEDMLFHKLTKQQINYYIKESLSLGRETAEDFKNKDIAKLLKENNIEVVLKEDKVGKKISLRAEIHFDNKIKRITIYKDSIKQIYETLKNSRFKLTEEEILNIHLAHEFYHFLEFKNDKYTNELLEKIVCFSLGPIKRKSTILRTREIAAHGFCKELLGLNFHPKALDYQYLIKNDKTYEKELLNEIKKSNE